MSTINSVRFEVLGVAEPKGSTRAFIPKGWTRPVITSANKNLRKWEDDIRAALQQQVAGIFFDGPVVVQVDFHLPRPASMSKKVMFHVKRPDADKLGRAVLDALTKTLWKDDSQVVEMRVAKHYTDGQPRAVIEVSACSSG